MQQCEGQGQRRVRHVGPSNIENPCNGIRHGEHGGIGIAGHEIARDAADLVGRRFARIFECVWPDLRHGRFRLVVPHGVERVRVDRHQRAARRLRRPAEPRHGVDRVQPGVVGEFRAFRQVFLDPARGRLVHQVLRLERIEVHLSAYLQRVAPVDEDRRLVLQHHGHAGRAVEARQPAQAFGMGRHIFALMLVRAGDQESVEVPAAKFLAELRGTGFSERRVGAVFIGLEHGLNVGVRTRGGNALLFRPISGRGAAPSTSRRSATAPRFRGASSSRCGHPAR